MLGAGFSYLIFQVKSFVQRQATIYGLMAAAGLILIFAAGYGLDAVREILVPKVGAVYASLIVGGALLVLALACLGAALYLGRPPRPAAATRKGLSSLPDVLRLPHVTGSAILAGGAVTGLVAGILAAKRPWRNAPTNDRTSDEQVHRARYR